MRSRPCCAAARDRTGSAPHDQDRCSARIDLVPESSETLDPQNWDDIRAQGHRMLDDMFDYAANIRERPVWSPIPDGVRARFREARSACAHRPRTRSIANSPISSFPMRPATFIRASWDGCMAAAAPSACWRRCWRLDSTPISAVATTCRSRSSARSSNGRVRCSTSRPRRSGIFVTGTSMANLMAVLVARTAALGQSVRQRGVGHEGASLTAYTSKAAHGCISPRRWILQVSAAMPCDASRSINAIASTSKRCARVLWRTAAPA